MAPAGSAVELAPASHDEAGAMLRELGPDEGVRILGGATKAGWGRPVEAQNVLSSRQMDQVVEHNTGDFTVVVQAGLPLARLQEELRGHRQRVSLDPPLGEDEQATVGGIVAAADSGPLRHRYGAPRDLILGVTVALADGTVAKSGGRVIKNVAGYDLGKLFAGAFGTLGLICQVALRLHPLPQSTATVVGRLDEPTELGGAAVALAGAPLEIEALDVAWADGSGTVLARLAGPAATKIAGRAQAVLAERGIDTEVAEGAREDELWRDQRRGQRSADDVVVRVSASSSRVGAVLTAARDVGASAVGRGGAGVVWLTLRRASADDQEAVVDELRERLGLACVVLDAPEQMRASFDVWGMPQTGETRLMGAVRARFDPQRRCNPGLFGTEL